MRAHSKSFQARYIHPIVGQQGNHVFTDASGLDASHLPTSSGGILSPTGRGSTVLDRCSFVSPCVVPRHVVCLVSCASIPKMTDKSPSDAIERLTKHGAGHFTELVDPLNGLIGTLMF